MTADLQRTVLRALAALVAATVIAVGLAPGAASQGSSAEMSVVAEKAASIGAHLCPLATESVGACAHAETSPHQDTASCAASACAAFLADNLGLLVAPDPIGSSALADTDRLLSGRTPFGLERPPKTIL